MTVQPEDSAVKRFAAGALDALSESKAKTSTAVSNWLHVVVIVASIIATSAVAYSELKAIDATLHEVKGAQQTNSSEVQALKLRVDEMTRRASEDRQKITSLQQQMSYRLAFEATAKAIHPETQW